MPTSGLYTRSVTGLDEHHDKLYSTQYQSVIRDYMERGLLGVSPFHRLQEYADPNFARTHAYFVEDGQSAVLCEKTSGQQPRELILEATGVLWTHHVYPFATRNDIFHESDYSPFGTQSVTIAGIGVESHNECLTALENIHVLASLRRQDGLLRDLQYVTIDNELVLPACANICTPLNQHKSTQQVVELTKEDDPEGVVAAFVKKRSGVITEDNLVEIYFGEQLHSAEEWIFHSCSGKLLRRGQIVKIELGFRIVDVQGGQFALRTDLKSVSIINEDIAQALAFTERSDRHDKRKRPTVLGSAGPSNILKRARVHKGSWVGKAGRASAQTSNDQDQAMDALPFKDST